MSARWSPAEVTRLAVEACREVGLRDRPALRFLQTNAIFALPESSLCLRVARPGVMSTAAVERQEALSRWFNTCGIAALSACDALSPLWVEDAACVFWQWEEHDRARTIGPTERGKLLRRVHEALETFSGELAQWEWPTRMNSAIETLTGGGLLNAHDASMFRQLLKRTIHWFQDSAPTAALAPIYGDFNLSNVIWSQTRGWVVIDYDHVCVGAREWDLTGCIHRHSEEEADMFAASYGEDVRGAPKFAPTSWLLFLGFVIWRLLGELDAPEPAAADKEADAAIFDWLRTDAQPLIANGSPMPSWADFVEAAHARMPTRGGNAPTHR